MPRSTGDSVEPTVNESIIIDAEIVASEESPETATTYSLSPLTPPPYLPVAAGPYGYPPTGRPPAPWPNPAPPGDRRFPIAWLIVVGAAFVGVLGACVIGALALSLTIKGRNAPVTYVAPTRQAPVDVAEGSHPTIDAEPVPEDAGYLVEPWPDLAIPSEASAPNMESPTAPSANLAEVRLVLSAAVNSQQEIIFVNDLGPLKSFRLPQTIYLDEEPITVVSLDEFRDALIVERSAGIAHSVSASLTGAPPVK